MAIRSISVVISANTSQYITGLKRAEAATRRFNSNVSTNTGSVRQAAAAQDGLAGSLHNVARGGNAAFNFMARYGAATRGGVAAVRGMSQEMGALNKAMFLTKSLAGEAIAALAGFAAIHSVITVTRTMFNFATDAIVSFDKAMTESLAIMNGNAPQLRAQMEKTAIAVSKATTFKPAEVAEGFYFLLSAGQTAEQSMESVGIAAKFAQAGVMGLEEATEMLLDVQAALGKVSKDPIENAQNMVEISDMITQAAIDSNATIQQLGESLTNKFGTALNLSNRPLQEGLTLLEAYARVGVKGRLAGTQAYMFLRDIQKAAVQNSQAFKALNIEVFDSEGNMNNLVQIVKDLKREFGGMSDKELRMSLKSMGWADKSVQATLPLIATDLETLEQNYNNLGKSMGKTSDVAQKQLGSISSRLKNLSNYAAEAAINLGKIVMNAGFTVWEKLSGSIGKTVENLVKFGKEILLPAIEPAAQLLGGTFVASLQLVAEILEHTTSWMNKLGFAIKPLITAFAVFKTAQFLMGAFGGVVRTLSHDFTMLKDKAVQMGQSVAANTSLASRNAAANQGALFQQGATIGQVGTSIGSAFKQGYQSAGVAQAGFFAKTKAGFQSMAAQAQTAGSSLAQGLQGGLMILGSIVAVAMSVNAQLTNFSDLGKEMAAQRMEKMDLVDPESIEKSNQALERLRSGIQDTKTGWNPFESLAKGRITGEVDKAIADNEKLLQNAKKNYAAISKETGFTAKEVQEAAVNMGKDLSMGFDDPDAKKNREAVIEYLDKAGKTASRMGLDVDAAARMGADGMNDMAMEGEEVLKNFSESLADWYDPNKLMEKIKATNEAIAQGFGASFSSVFEEANSALQEAQNKQAEAAREAANKSVDNQIEALQRAKKDTADKYGSKKTSAEKEMIESENEAIDEQIDALQELKGAKSDLEKSDSTVGLGAFLTSLKQTAEKSREFNTSLGDIRQRLYNIMPMDSADTIVQQFASLGEEGLPLIQEFAAAAPEQFRIMSEQIAVYMEALNPKTNVTFQQLRDGLAQTKQENEQIGLDLFGLAGAMGAADTGVDPTMIAKFMALGPEYAAMIGEMMDSIDAGGSAQEVADVIKETLMRKEFGQGAIPEAIMDAMTTAYNEAQKGANGITQALYEGIARPEVIIQALRDAGLDNLAGLIANELGFALPAAGATPTNAMNKPRQGYGSLGAKETQKASNPAQGYGSLQAGKQSSYPVVVTPAGPYNAKYIPPGLKEGQMYIDATRNNMLRKAGYFADGGVEKHQAMIGKGTTRVWNEPETGGEAYIPLAMSKRSRSEQILGTVAREFGYSLVAFGRGGVARYGYGGFNTAGSSMVGGSRFGTAHQQPQTVVVPVTSKNETNFNGPIQGVRMEEAMAFAERKKRQSRLAGGGVR